MAISKAIFPLLLISFFTIQVDAGKASHGIVSRVQVQQCPHLMFLLKHVCHNCKTVADLEAFALDVANNVRKFPVIVQTIYTIVQGLTWVRYTVGTELLCRTNVEYNKVECKKGQYECIPGKKGNAEHPMVNFVRGRKTCPDSVYANTKLCWSCKNETDVAIYARNVANGANNPNPPKKVTIYILNNRNELNTNYWVPKGNKCKLKGNPKDFYVCTQKPWDCSDAPVQGFAKHNLNLNGHLEDD